MKNFLFGSKSARCRLALRIIAIVIFCPLALLPSACKDNSKAEAPKEQPSVERKDNRVFIPEGSPLRDRLTVEAIGPQNVPHLITSPASVEADPARTAKVLPPLAGRISKLNVRIGDKVNQGAILLTMDAPDLVAAQADYYRARSVLIQAERTLARQKDLAEHGILGQREVDQAQTDLDGARSDLDRTRARLRLLGVRPESENPSPSLPVFAPISGHVLDLSTAPGEFRNDPTAVLMVIGDLSTVWVTANVQEKDIPAIHKGEEATATLAAFPGQLFRGQVLFVGNLLDPDTRTVKVRIAFQNQDNRLKPGMFASVSFTSSIKSELVVPTTSLIMAGERSTVFVEVAPWTFEQRVVETGEQQGSVAVIKSGLEAGTRVVTQGGVLLQ